MCKPQESHTDLIPKQMIGQTLVETYIYLIHFSWLYLYVVSIPQLLLSNNTLVLNHYVQQKRQVLQACYDEKIYERRQEFH